MTTIVKDFIKYLDDSKMFVKGAFKNQEVIDVITAVVNNPIAFVDDPHVQIILSEYEEWWELYCPMNKMHSDEQLMRAAMSGKISNEDCEIGMAYLAYITHTITNK